MKQLGSEHYFIIRNQVFVLKRFLDEFGDRKLSSISPDEILTFLNSLTRGQKQTTKRIRYANLKTFFNFAISTSISNSTTPAIRGEKF